MVRTFHVIFVLSLRWHLFFEIFFHNLGFDFIANIHFLKLFHVAVGDWPGGCERLSVV